MPCPESVLQAPAGKTWRNTMGTTEVAVERYYEPTSLRELVTILHRAEAQGERVHAVGAGYSFENLAATQDWMVDLRNLCGLIPSLTTPAIGRHALSDDWRTRHFGDGPDKLAHVLAGTRLYDLCQALDPTPEEMDSGLALPTMGGALGQHVAGAFSTSTHGSDIGQPPLCDLVQAVHLVTKGGREMWIESASHPLTDDDAALREVLQAGEPENQACHDLEIVRDDDLLNAVVVSMGRFGVIYSVVLQVTSAFHLAEYSQEMSWTEVASALRDGIGHDNPFEVLESDLLEDPPEDLVDGDTAGYRYLDIIFSTRDSNTCWVRRRWKTSNREALNVTPSTNIMCHKGMANGILQLASAGLRGYATLVGGSIPFYGIGKAIEINIRAGELDAMVQDPHLTGGKALAAALNAIWASQIAGVEGELSPLVNEIANSEVEGAILPGDAKTKGRRGKNWVISAGSEDPESIGVCFQGNSIEIIFGLDTRAYIDFVDQVTERFGQYKQSGWLSIRFTRRSQALLSMHNVNHNIACSIEITTLKDLADNDRWMEWIEQVALAMGGRPHWGQQNNLQALQVERLYGPQRLEEWRAQLSRVVGNSMTFSNSYTRQRGLEPARASLVHAAWVHGHYLEVEFPDRVARETPFGFYYRLEGEAESANWLHFAIPTPVMVDGQRLMVDSVMLRYRSVGGALVHAVHVYDGEEKIAEHNGLSQQPTHWAFERYGVAGKPEVHWGLGISVGVRFPEAGAKIEFASAGCDFLGWEF